MKRVGGVFSCVNKGQRDHDNKGAAHSNLKVSRVESLKLNVALAEKGI